MKKQFSLVLLISAMILSFSCSGNKTAVTPKEVQSNNIRDYLVKAA